MDVLDNLFGDGGVLFGQIIGDVEEALEAEEAEEAEDWKESNNLIADCEEKPTKKSTSPSSNLDYMIGKLYNNLFPNHEEEQVQKEKTLPIENDRFGTDMKDIKKAKAILKVSSQGLLYDKNIPSLRGDNINIESELINFIKLRNFEEAFSICTNGPNFRALPTTIFSKFLGSPQSPVSRSKLAKEKLEIIVKAKNKASLNAQSGMKHFIQPQDLSKKCQKQIQDEFIKRLNDIFHDPGFPTLPSISREADSESSECRANNIYQGKCFDKSVQKTPTALEPGILFKCSASTGHLKGLSSFVEISITKNEVQISSNGFVKKVALSSIDEIRIDEFMQVCFLFYQEDNKNDISKFAFENIPSRNLSNFILTLDFLLRSTKGSQNFIYMFSWNFYLRLSPQNSLVHFACPVNVSIISNSPYGGNLIAQESWLMFNTFSIDSLKQRKPSNWQNAFFSLRVNTLYLFKSEDEELPDTFWILNNQSFVIEGNEGDDRPHTLRVIPEEGCILNLSFPSLSMLKSWKNSLDAAMDFKADEILNNQVDKSVEVKITYLGWTCQSFFLFTCDESGTKFEVKKADELNEVKVKEDKYQIQMKFDVQLENSTIWKVTFYNQTNLEKLRACLGNFGF